MFDTRSADEIDFQDWHNEVKSAEEGGDTPEYLRARKVASDATQAQLDAHELRRKAIELDEMATKAENRARMMIFTAAEATSKATETKQIKARIPEGGLGAIISAVQNDSEQYVVLELFGQEEKMNAEVAAALATACTWNKHVKTINLANGMAGDAGTRELCKALLQNRRIESLNLKSNAITDDGAFAIANMLKANKTLTYLNVGNSADKMSSTNTNTITDKGLRVICEALHTNSTLKKVVFNNLPKVTDFGANSVMAMVAVNRGLTDVYLEGRSGISSKQRQSMRTGNKGEDEEKNSMLD